MDDFKTRVESLLKAIILSITNTDNFVLHIGRIAQDDTLVIDIKVPSDKVGIVLGRRDMDGTNPMKLAILKIVKQTAYYYGFKEVLIKVGEITNG